ncbi:thioredoxin fold domain-containing protein [Marinobacter psychrophilus]|uniref:thioredoxin fold domain-containing protein n=1 Tax=Marinobacter psychrophilus TaxID=330734 RepID=UPI001B58540D|nr:thioredoxin fold domain-containing protein [Marinobacter psychrophilus]MBQ0762858.1 thioredoxin fold domain-containing protein [Marinobacter psychrophilus]MBQ0846204.1 thioredoxin fold domain-containing protein [Marinobacter psychrophilus]
MSFSMPVISRFIAVALFSGLLLPAFVAAADIEERITQRLQTAVPGLQIESMAPAKAPGIYEVRTNSGQIVYATEDAEYLFIGDLVKLESAGYVNLTEQARTSQRRQTINEHAKNGGLIQYAAKGEQKVVIDVFTDIDCGYCRKLHGEMDELNELGITVNYFGFPRSGPGTESFRKYVSVWCAKDPQAAMNKAKSGGSVSSADCANPVAEQYNLGRLVGVTGTPAIVLEDGTLMPGYVPAKTLARSLGIL